MYMLHPVWCSVLCSVPELANDVTPMDMDEIGYDTIFIYRVRVCTQLIKVMMTIR